MIYMSALIISPHSMKCMDALREQGDIHLPIVTINTNGMHEASSVDIVNWLTMTGHTDSNSRFILESLRAALLSDLCESIAKKNEAENQSTQAPTESVNYLKFFLLMFAGTVFAICEGYDCVTSMLNLFSGIPSLFVLTVGAAFSLLSIILFYGFDLVEISKNLEVKFSKSSQILDIFIRQTEQIRLIRRLLVSRCAMSQSLEEWHELQQISQMLIVRYNDLDRVRRVYVDALDDPYLKTLKFTTAVFAGVIFFGSGFFASQSLALGVVSIFMLSATVTSFPVVALCSFVGLAACAVYWYVERPGLENLVGRWMGLDRDDINVLADEDDVNTHKNKLIQLSRSIDKMIAMQTQIDKLTSTVKQSKPFDQKLKRSFSASDISSPHCRFFHEQPHQPLVIFDERSQNSPFL